MEVANEKPAYKMGGPKGVLVLLAFFTCYTFFITTKCQTGQWGLLELPWLPCNVTTLLDLRIAFWLLLWFILQCFLYVLPVGRLEKGVKINNGNQLSYRMNALFVLNVNMALMLVAILCGYDVGKVNDSLPKLLVSAMTMCFIFSIYLYICGGYAKPDSRNSHGNTGNVLYDWFMGRELNPRWRAVDIKYVMFRSGIIGWVILDLCNVYEYWNTYKSVNSILILVTLLQLFYVVDYFWFERGVIVSRDIVHEGLGFNILFQFLMIPFCFCVQTRYIQTTNVIMEWYIQIALGLLYGTGYYIYRASNTEKNNFRSNPHDPNLAHLRTMSTSTGRRLLISGWWGMCRHPNYLGDLLISLSYALSTGIEHVIPYLGTAFLVLLLVDREQQDNADCKRKYGKDWDKYCTIVKYRIIPGVY